MSLDLRARAATALLALFAFNPHQRRGPDGRWVKMADHELKRPRRGKGPRTPQKHEPQELQKPKPPKPQRLEDGKPPINLPDPEVDYRRRRDEYNNEVMFYAQAKRLETAGTPQADQTLQYAIEDVEEQVDQEDRDLAIDRLRRWLNNLHGGLDALTPAPEREEAPLPTLPPGPRTSGGARPPKTASHEQRRVALDNSVRSGIDGQRALGAGKMGDTRRFQLADGTQAIYKRALHDWAHWDKRAQTDAEELAALVADAFDVRAPAVQRVSDDELYMEVVPGSNAASTGWTGFSAEDRQLFLTDSAFKMGLFDTIVNNADRHTGNWMIDGEDLYAIDHGLAFEGRETGSSQAIKSLFARSHFIEIDGSYRAENYLSPSDVEYLRRRLDELEPKFQQLDRGEWLDDMRTRLDYLEERAIGTRNFYPR